MKKLAIYSCIVISLFCLALFLLESCTPTKAKETVVSMIGGEAITLAAVDQRAESQLYQYLFGIYYTRKYEAEKLISEKLLQYEAKAQGLSVDQLLKKAVDTKMTSTAQQKFVVENHMQTGIILSDDPFHPLDIQSEAGKTHLKKLFRQYLLEEYIQTLRKKYKVALQLKPPLSPRISLSGVEKYTISTANTGKEIVVVGNFSCANCKKYKPLFDSLLQVTTGKLSFSYVPYNTQVAEYDMVAAYVAQKQKFKYVFDALYQSDNTASISAYALLTKAGEPVAGYETFKATQNIRKKLEASFNLLGDKGITGTPTLLIDGRIYHGNLSMEDIQEYLDQHVYTE